MDVNDRRGPNRGFYVRIRLRAKVRPRGACLGLASTYLVLPVPHRPLQVLAASGQTISAGRTGGSFAVFNSGAAPYTHSELGIAQHSDPEFRDDSEARTEP
jgi:hypothetical protein